MVNKTTFYHDFQNLFRWTYFLFIIRGFILIFIYVCKDEFIYSGLGLSVLRGSDEYIKAREM